MRRSVILLALLFLMGCARHVSGPRMTVTYVANTGFIVECGSKKIMIDALFGGFKSEWYYVPSDSVVSLMTHAMPPFDHADIIAVTHAHIDHFNLRIVADHLLNDRKAILVCPQQVADSLAESARYDEFRDRINVLSPPLDSFVETTIAGIGIKAIRTRHLPYDETDSITGETVDRHQDIQNLEYLLTIGGETIFHSGDGALNDRRVYQRSGFGDTAISLAFLPWWDAGDMLTFQQTIVHDEIRPERVIMMHMRPGREPKGHPERQQTVADQVIVPQHTMQRWTFPLSGEMSKPQGF